MPQLIPILPLPIPDELAAVAVFRDGVPLRLNQVIGHLPGPAAKFTELLFSLRGAEEVSLRLKEMVILRIAQRRGCGYIFSQHAAIGLAAGLTADEVAALAAADAAWPWAEPDVAALALVDDLDQTGAVSGTAGKALTAHFDAAQIVGLQMVAGVYRTLAGILNSAGLEGDSNTPDYPIRRG